MTVAELLDSPEKWCQGTMATRAGWECDINDPDAECWCLTGAIFRVYDNTAYTQIHKAVHHLSAYWGNEALIALQRWNDDPARTFDEVRAVIERAQI